MQCLPDALLGREYYRPAGMGEEEALKRDLRKSRHGKGRTHKNIDLKWVLLYNVKVRNRSRFFTTGSFVRISISICLYKMKEECIMVKAVVGANWGDEGKGKITDLLAEKSDMVIRFQGGANAGHTIICDYGRFALHQLPSGVFYPHTVNIIGPGVALDVKKFLEELQQLSNGGVPAPPHYGGSAHTTAHALPRAPGYL